jgi:hypothetical protein
MGATKWFVRFEGGFQSREEVFAAFAMLTKVPQIRDSPMFLPTASDINTQGKRKLSFTESNRDIKLVAEGMTVRLKRAITPTEITEPTETTEGHISFGVGHEGLVDADLWIQFDKFPDSLIKVYKARGRPRKDIKRAQVKGERASGKKWSEIAGKIDTSEDAARHYQREGPLKRKVRAGTEAAASGLRKPPKTSEN